MDFTRLSIEEIKTYYKKKQEVLKRKYDERREKLEQEKDQQRKSEIFNEHWEKYQKFLQEGKYIFIF
jgi:ribosomal protein L14E/L6E/L27E